MRCNIFGVRYDDLDRQQTIKVICEAIELGGATLHRGDLNVATLVQAYKDPHFRGLVNSADLINMDGVGALWGARFLGLPKVERVAGVDLFEDLLVEFEKRSIPIFLLGATEEVLCRTIRVIQKKHPRLKIAGSRNGYFSDGGAVASQVREAGAKALFVGMTSPLKEQFIDAWKKEVGVNFVMGVGGAFDVVAGKVSRAPRWMQVSGLEWFFRVLQEPRRMWRRYLETNSLFAFLLVREKFYRRGNGFRG